MKVIIIRNGNKIVQEITPEAERALLEVVSKNQISISDVIDIAIASFLRSYIDKSIRVAFIPENFPIYGEFDY